MILCADSRSPEQAEQLKQQQLKEQKEGKGKWHEGLASDSESAVSWLVSTARSRERIFVLTRIRDAGQGRPRRPEQLREIDRRAAKGDR